MLGGEWRAGQKRLIMLILEWKFISQVDWSFFPSKSPLIGAPAPPPCLSFTVDSRKKTNQPQNVYCVHSLFPTQWFKWFLGSVEFRHLREDYQCPTRYSPAVLGLTVVWNDLQPFATFIPSLLHSESCGYKDPNSPVSLGVVGDLLRRSNSDKVTQWFCYFSQLNFWKIHNVSRNL